MKRKFIVFLAFVLLMASALAMFTDASAKTYVKCKVDTGEASGANFWYDVAVPYNKGLKNGTKVLLSGKASKWNPDMLQVRTASGKVGYVFRDYLHPYGTVSDDDLYCTTCACTGITKSGKFETLKKGTKVRCVSVKGKWACVKNASGKYYAVKKANLKSCSLY